MKPICSLLIITILGFSACQKDPALKLIPAPKASFTVDGRSESDITLKSTVNYSLNDLSENGATFAWNLGEGVFSTKKDDVFSISKAGNYTLLLTVKNIRGESAVISKKIKVVSPLLKTIVLSKINWNNDEQIPKSDKADIWMEIVKKEKDKQYPLSPDGLFDAPLVYRSPVIKDALPNDNSITFNIPEKIIIDETAVRDGRYGVRLSIKNTSGTYTLFHSNYSGSNSVFNGKTTPNQFNWTSGAYVYNIEMSGYYE